MVAHEKILLSLNALNWMSARLQHVSIELEMMRSHMEATGKKENTDKIPNQEVILEEVARKLHNTAEDLCNYMDGCDAMDEDDDYLSKIFEMLNADPNYHERPTIVCLCGSTKFWREYQKAGLQETLKGKIVLSIGAASGTDDEHFGNMPKEKYDKVKAMLDELHKRKIDEADEVLVLDVGGYIGESTKSEIEYATAHRKWVRYWEDEQKRKGPQNA